MDDSFVGHFADLGWVPVGRVESLIVGGLDDARREPGSVWEC